MSGTYLALAKDIYIELNEAHSLDMKNLHDNYLPELYTERSINIDYVDDRISTPDVRVNPKRIKGIVLTNKYDSSSEVIQDSIFELLDSDTLRFASTTTLTFSSDGQKRFHRELHDLKSKFILRSMEISNNPEVIR
ncbi:unnamed protein product [Rotaria sp. Silwood1]|nr:unnamed protein product [Rotaria sp. Silwood1]